MDNIERGSSVVSDNNRVRAARDPAYEMGVDYGTPAGRAVVASVSDAVGELRREVVAR